MPRLISGLIFRIFSNAVAIIAANQLVEGFIFEGDLLALIITAIILTLINIFIKPIIKLFLSPFIVLTLGLFIIVINAFTLYILDIFSQPLTIEGLIPLLWSTLIIGVINFLINSSAKSLYRK